MNAIPFIRREFFVRGLTRGGPRPLLYCTQGCGGGIKRITLIEGRGSGPALCTAVRQIFKAADVPVEWDRQTIRVQRDPRTGKSVINMDLMQSAKDTGVVLCGPDSSGNSPDDHRPSVLTLQKGLDTYVGLRLFASVDGHEPFGHIRMVNISDNVSSEYSEIEHTVVQGVVQSIKTVTRLRSEAVAKFAFEYALKHGHCRVTALHKANVMRMTDGTFLRACRRVSAGFPNVDYCEERLDKFCLVVVDNPNRYDVLLTPSLYGSLASAACSSLSGGAAIVPSVAYGYRVAVFGTMADDDTGYQRYCPAGIDPVADRYHVANPLGIIRSAVLMLVHVGLVDAALRISTALHSTVQQGVLTKDMGGTASCVQFTDAIISNLSRADGHAKFFCYV